MKTFKIVSLHIAEADTLKPISFYDGLIINKEDGKGTWLIEIYTPLEYHPYFLEAEENKRALEVDVVITHESNDPASLTTNVRGIKKFQDAMSVLLEGHIQYRKNDDHVEQILTALVSEGFQGKELVQEFKLRLNRK
ncbi:YwpF family protein [Heyndrickxia ginsengihumi]|uniref:YwpF family protein n=1 Tax=Heyndrickxia ginsengihumi TaxID=363870 RepID=UPI003D193099